MIYNRVIMQIQLESKTNESEEEFKIRVERFRSHYLWDKKILIEDTLTDYSLGVFSWKIAIEL